MPIVPVTITFSGKTLLDPRALARECEKLGLPTKIFEGRCNSFTLPRGKEAGRGFILLSKAQYDDLDLTTSHTLRFRVDGVNHDIERLYVIQKYSILGGQVESANDILMVEISDARFLAPLGPYNKNIGLYSPDYTNKFDDTEDYTFTEAVADLYAAVPGVFTGITNNGAYPTGKAEGYCFHGISAWDGLFQLLDDTDNIGYVSRSGQFNILNADNDDNANLQLQADNLSKLLHHSHGSRTDVSLFPEKVRVYFPKRNFSFQTAVDQFQVTATEFWRFNVFDHVDITTTAIVPDADVIAGTTAILYDSLNAAYNQIDVAQNAAALTTRATSRATQYLSSRRIADAATHQIYSGAIDFTPGSRIAAVSWYDLGEGVKTEIVLFPRKKYEGGFPRIDTAALGLSNLVYLRSFSELSTSEYPGPPDLSRDHLPFERWAVVETTEAIAPYSNGTCFVKFGGTGGTFANDDKTIEVFDIYGCRYESGEDLIAMWHTQAKIWIAVTGCCCLKRFELTATLTLGDSAAAELLAWNGAAYAKTGQVITVTDFTANPGSWAGLTGYQGWCVWMKDTAQYEIVWMEMVARYIEFTLTGTLTETAGRWEATATVNRYWHIKDPGASVTVTDVQGLFKRAQSGAKGIAIWDERRNYYIIVECQSKAGWIWIELTADMADNAGTIEATADVDGFKGTQQDIQTPGASITVIGIPGISDELKDGDQVVALYSSEDDRYYALAKPNTPMWARTQANWEENAGDPLVSVKLIPARTSGDGDVIGTAFDVYLPRCNDGDPNVIASRNICFMYDNNGDAVCLTDYMDDPIGTTVFHLETTRAGWGRQDGTANATPAGSGYDSRDRFLLHLGTNFGTLGGTGGENPHDHFIACFTGYTTDGPVTNRDQDPAEFYALAGETGGSAAQIYIGDGSTGSTDGANPAVYTSTEMPAYLILYVLERLDNASD